MKKILIIFESDQQAHRWKDNLILLMGRYTVSCRIMPTSTSAQETILKQLTSHGFDITFTTTLKADWKNLLPGPVETLRDSTRLHEIIEKIERLK